MPNPVLVSCLDARWMHCASPKDLAEARDASRHCLKLLCVHRHHAGCTARQMDGCCRQCSVRVCWLHFSISSQASVLLVRRGAWHLLVPHAGGVSSVTYSYVARPLNGWCA
jgi:hypothetical protein